MDQQQSQEIEVENADSVLVLKDFKLKESQFQRIKKYFICEPDNMISENKKARYDSKQLFRDYKKDQYGISTSGLAHLICEFLQENNKSLIIRILTYIQQKQLILNFLTQSLSQWKFYFDSQSNTLMQQEPQPNTFMQQESQITQNQLESKPPATFFITLVKNYLKAKISSAKAQQINILTEQIHQISLESPSNQISSDLRASKSIFYIQEHYEMIFGKKINKNHQLHTKKLHKTVTKHYHI